MWPSSHWRFGFGLVDFLDLELECLHISNVRLRDLLVTLGVFCWALCFGLGSLLVLLSLWRVVHLWVVLVLSGYPDTHALYS